MKTVNLFASKGQQSKTLLQETVGWSGRFFSRGIYAHVYWSQSLRRVVKVGALDDAYLKYVHLIKREKSTLVPRIDKLICCHDYGVKRWENRDRENSRGSYAVIMERLYHARTSKQRAIRDLIIEAIDPEGCISLKLISEANPQPAFLDDLIKVARRITRPYETGTLDVELDMHNDNVMFRSNGQAVITDPYC
jgi:hypothetical protein